MLFVMRDNRYGLNYITILRAARNTGELLTRFEVHVPLQNSSYKLLESTENSASFLLQGKTAYGYNLVKCRISGNGEAVFEDLTKTRPPSIQSAFLKLDGWKSLVFSDMEDGKHTVYFASENPVLMKVSARVTFSDIFRIAGAVVTNGIVAAFLGAVYILIVPILPFGMVLVLTRNNGRTETQNNLICGFSGALNTILKLAVVYYILNRSGNDIVSAPVVGGEPIIYVVITLMTILSYFLVLGNLNSSKAERKTVSGLFFRFLLIDTLQLTLIFNLYVATGLMAGKF
jgi:hypothetical protein